MEVPAYRVKRNPDDSIDVWVESRRIHFPLAGEPFVDQQPMPDDADASDATVELQAAEDSVGVRCCGRLVLISPDGAVVVPEAPPQNSGVFYRRLRMGRLRG
jgi:hypothetical protein